MSVRDCFFFFLFSIFLSAASWHSAIEAEPGAAARGKNGADFIKINEAPFIRNL